MTTDTVSADSSPYQSINSANRWASMVSNLHVDPSIVAANEIDDIAFRRSEYLGGMAAVLLSIVAG